MQPTSQALPSRHAARDVDLDARPDVPRWWERRSSALASLVRPAGRLVAAILLLFGMVYLGLVVRRQVQPAPTFDDASAYIDGTNCSISPDGKTVYVFLQHPGGINYRDSVWAVDVATLEQARLPDAALALHPFMPGGLQCISSVASWDGEHVLGAFQRGDQSEFFATHVPTQTTRFIDWATFMGDANYSGWRFERVRPLLGGQRAHIRASRPATTGAEGGVESFMIDTYREPAVAAANPMQLFYTASDGTVHHLDASTGEDRPLSLMNQGGGSLRVSSDARWLSVHLGNSKALLFETTTGKSRLFPHAVFQMAPGDWPVARRTVHGENQWTLSGLEDDQFIVPDVPVGTLRPIGSDRFLGIDAKTEAAYILDREGRLLKTLRAPTS